jgi:peptidoglycan hydrolase CwlO-like protein
MYYETLVVTIIIIFYLITKVIDALIKVLENNKSEIYELKELNTEIKKEIRILEERVKTNYSVIYEEINDIYPAIKYINTEIMYIKQK